MSYSAFENMRRQLEWAERQRQQFEQMTRSVHQCSMAAYIEQEQQRFDTIKMAFGGNLEHFNSLRRIAERIRAASRPFDALARQAQSIVAPQMQAYEKLRSQMDRAATSASLPSSLLAQLSQQSKWSAQQIQEDVDALTGVSSAEWDDAAEVLAELDVGLPEQASDVDIENFWRRVFTALKVLHEKHPGLASIVLFFILQYCGHTFNSFISDPINESIPALLSELDLDDESMDLTLLSAYRAVTTPTDVRSQPHDDAVSGDSLEPGHLLCVITGDGDEEWMFVSYTRLDGSAGSGWICADHVTSIGLSSTSE